MSENLTQFINAIMPYVITIVTALLGYVSVAIKNKISKKLTFIFTGQQKNYLLQYGNIFEAIPGEIIYLKGNNPEFKTFTTVQKAVEYTLSKEIITNTNFNIKQIEHYEF